MFDETTPTAWHRRSDVGETNIKRRRSSVSDTVQCARFIFLCPSTAFLIISLACWPLTEPRQKLPGACMTVCSSEMQVVIFHLGFDVRVTMWGCDRLRCRVLFRWSVWIIHGHYSERGDLTITCGFLVCIMRKRLAYRETAEAIYSQPLRNKTAFVSQILTGTVFETLLTCHSYSLNQEFIQWW